ncbi:cation-translocating P-type ATPase [Candidatus Sumerlaeota bacterium]|nr:cation-translocating P-type ATPase [Candidatus Sumerlaeota bacterium]
MQIAPLAEAERKTILETNSALAGAALRVLALAYVPVQSISDDLKEEHLIFLGLAGMKDPPREEARLAVEKCHEAGIRPVMITGDHPLTASAIARELGIAPEGAQTVTGRQLDQWSDEELIRNVEQIAVFARVTAEHKLRIVKALKSRGHVVAMTGDGVNDAPAIKSADIGIAMGIAGTDVTKEAADMVLTDDNFASIVNAVEEGRGIFDNIQKFVHYLLSCNAGEVMFMFFAALMGWPTPLVAVQILWINLVTDGLPALALGMEPTESDVMRRPPRPPREPVITRAHGLEMFIHGLLMGAACAAGFAWFYYGGPGDPVQLTRARTVTFCIMAYSELFYVFSCRSRYHTMPELGLFSNPALFGAVLISGLLQLSVVTLPYAEKVFETAAHFRSEWTVILVLSLTPVTIIEMTKLLRNYFRAP